MKTEDILTMRGKTHGSFPYLAQTAQGLKAHLIGPDVELNDVQREAMEFICTKLARIVCGNPDEPDHWADIAGYARLVADHLEQTANAESDAPMFKARRPLPEPTIADTAERFG